MILAFCWSIAIWYCASKTPAISAYPQVDYASKLKGRSATEPYQLFKPVRSESDDSSIRRCFAATYVVAVRDYELDEDIDIGPSRLQQIELESATSTAYQSVSQDRPQSLASDEAYDASDSRQELLARAKVDPTSQPSEPLSPTRQAITRRTI